MKKILIILLCLLTTSTLAIMITGHFWRGDTLSISEVKKRWGDKTFNSEKFKTSSTAIKASMAYSLLKQKEQFIDKFVLDIRKELGTPDGFYFKDIFPAYLIHKGKDRAEDSWQIVFTLDGTTRKVSDVFVHKNCCD